MLVPTQVFWLERLLYVLTLVSGTRLRHEFIAVVDAPERVVVDVLVGARQVDDDSDVGSS